MRLASMTAWLTMSEIRAEWHTAMRRVLTVQANGGEMTRTSLEFVVPYEFDVRGFFDRRLRLIIETDDEVEATEDGAVDDASRARGAAFGLAIEIQKARLKEANR